MAPVERPQPPARLASAATVASAAAKNLATLDPPGQRARLAPAPVAAAPERATERVRLASAAAVASAAASNLAALDPPRQGARLTSSAVAAAIGTGEPRAVRESLWRPDVAAAIANAPIVTAPVQRSINLPPVTGSPAHWRGPRDPSALVPPPILPPLTGRSLPGGQAALVTPVGGPIGTLVPTRLDNGSFVFGYRPVGRPVQRVDAPFTPLPPQRRWLNDPFPRLGPPLGWASDPLSQLGLPLTWAHDFIPRLGLLPAQPIVVPPLPIFVPVPAPAPILTLVGGGVPAPCLVTIPQPVLGPVPAVVPQIQPALCLVQVPPVVPQPGFPTFPFGPVAAAPPFLGAAPQPGFSTFPFAAGSAAPPLLAAAPQPGFPLYPPPPGGIAPPLGEPFAPAPSQEAPLQLLSLEDGEYALGSLPLACDGADAWACAEPVDQPPASAVWLGSGGSDAPASYGSQTTYVSQVAAPSNAAPAVSASDAAAPNDEALDADSGEYALIHPLLLCEVDEAGVCGDEMADELAAVAPGFAVTVMDGPDGYGIYLTYADDSAPDADSGEYALIHPLVLCEVDEAGACGDEMADELAAVAPGFAVSVMDGPDGYGIYLTYADDAAPDAG
ncbi:MAG TPA: hypothetical protein VII06_09975 [Chloroflexota bacterium]